MEGKDTKILNKSNDDLKSINDTITFAYYIVSENDEGV
jgi:hypothetical protein